MQTLASLVSNMTSPLCRQRQRQNTSLMLDLLTNPTLPQLIYVAVFCCFISLVPLLLKRSARSKPSPRSVAILVLGDVGRSPRMMYHAESFAKLQFETFLVGYQGNVTSILANTSPRLLTGQLAACRLQTDTFTALSPTRPLSVHFASATFSPETPIHSICAPQNCSANTVDTLRSPLAHPSPSRVYTCTSKSSCHLCAKVV